MRSEDGWSLGNAKPLRRDRRRAFFRTVANEPRSARRSMRLKGEATCPDDAPAHSFQYEALIERTQRQDRRDSQRRRSLRDNETVAVTTGCSICRTDRAPRNRRRGVEAPSKKNRSHRHAKSKRSQASRNRRDRLGIDEHERHSIVRRRYRQSADLSRHLVPLSHPVRKTSKNNWFLLKQSRAPKARRNKTLRDNSAKTCVTLHGPHAAILQTAIRVRNDQYLVATSKRSNSDNTSKSHGGHYYVISNANRSS